MNVLPASLPDVLIIEPTVFGDERGFFFESYNAREFSRLTGVAPQFVQDNYSHSRRNVLRGLHYQVQQVQAKLVRVAAGEIFDVVVDLRTHSPTFGKWTSTVLSAQNRRMLWVPVGFAHGFLVVSETADVEYKVTDYYAPQCERCIRWDDPQLNVSWPITTTPTLSDRDRKGLLFANSEPFV